MSELSFKDKEFVCNHHLSVPFRPLVIHADKGIGEPSLDGNLIVHGHAAERNAARTTWSGVTGRGSSGISPAAANTPTSRWHSGCKRRRLVLRTRMR